MVAPRSATCPHCWDLIVSQLLSVCFPSGSHHSGSPSAHCSKSSGSLDTSKVYIVSQGSGQQAPGSMSKPYHRQGAVNTSPGLRRSAPQVHGAPPECSCPSQTGSSRGHQTSPRDAVPTPGRCCLSQGRHCTLSQRQKRHLCAAAVDTEPKASGFRAHSL